MRRSFNWCATKTSAGAGHPLIALERHAKKLREKQSKKRTTQDAVDRLLDRF